MDWHESLSQLTYPLSKNCALWLRLTHSSCDKEIGCEWKTCESQRTNFTKLKAKLNKPWQKIWSRSNEDAPICPCCKCVFKVVMKNNSKRWRKTESMVTNSCALTDQCSNDCVLFLQGLRSHLPKNAKVAPDEEMTWTITTQSITTLILKECGYLSSNLISVFSDQMMCNSRFASFFCKSEQKQGCSFFETAGYVPSLWLWQEEKWKDLAGDEILSHDLHMSKQIMLCLSHQEAKKSKTKQECDKVKHWHEERDQNCCLLRKESLIATSNKCTQRLLEHFFTLDQAFDW